MAVDGEVFEYVVRFTEADVRSLFVRGAFLFIGASLAWMVAWGYAERESVRRRPVLRSALLFFTLLAYGCSVEFWGWAIHPKHSYAAIVAKRLVEVAP